MVEESRTLHLMREPLITATLLSIYVEHARYGQGARRDPAPVLDQTHAVGDRRGLRAGAHVELGENARDVDGRRLLGHVQGGADLSVRAPVRQEREDLAFARCEPERVFTGIRGSWRGCRRRLVGLQPQPCAQREALDLRGQPARADRAARRPAPRAAASADASRSPPASSASALRRVACAARYGRPERRPGRLGGDPQRRVVVILRRAPAPPARWPGTRPRPAGRPRRTPRRGPAAPSAVAIANAGSSPRSRARTAASASTRTPVAATRAIRATSWEQKSSRSSASSIAARAASRSPVRRSSSAFSAPSGPIHCGSRLSAATSQDWSSSMRAALVVAAAERELDPPQRVVDERHALRGPARRRQRRLGRGPVAGLERELGADQHQPAARQALGRGELVALGGDLARLGEPAGGRQRVGEVHVRARVLHQALVAGPRVGLAQELLALLVAAEPEQRHAGRVQRAQLGHRVADRAGDLERLARRPRSPRRGATRASAPWPGRRAASRGCSSGASGSRSSARRRVSAASAERPWLNCSRATSSSRSAARSGSRSPSSASAARR